MPQLRLCMPQLRSLIPRTTTKTQFSQNKSLNKTLKIKKEGAGWICLRATPGTTPSGVSAELWTILCQISGVTPLSYHCLIAHLRGSASGARWRSKDCTIVGNSESRCPWGGTPGLRRQPEQVIEGATANERRLLPWFCFDFIVGVVTALFRPKRTLVLPECLYWTEVQVCLLFS